MGTIRRIRIATIGSAVAAVALVAAGAIVAVVDGRAGAVEQARVVINGPGVLRLDYPALLGTTPVAAVAASDAYDKETCTAVTYCDAIPLTVEIPTDGEYFVTLELAWDSQRIDDVPALGEAQANDLDLLVHNDPIVPDAGPDEDGFTYKSASFRNPERVTMYEPRGNWWILVGNSIGVNVGYRLTFTTTVDPPPDLRESLPPAGGDTPAPAAAIGPQAPSSGAAPSIAGPADEGAGEGADLAPGAPATPDTDFGAADDDRSFADELAAARPAAVTDPVAEPASSPSTLALLLWMVAFPLALVALGGAVLLRRRTGILVLSGDE